MITETNLLDVPEVRNYSRQEIEGGIVIRYEVRQPGERDWQPVKLFVPEDASASAIGCIRSQVFVPIGG